jgi:thiol-disulfide isomerase/thioredoxin
MEVGTSFYRFRAGALAAAAATLVACSNSGFGAHMRPPPTVRNSDITLAYRRGWIVRAVKSIPGMTLREGDQLLAIDGKPATQMSPLEISWLVNQTFISPVQAQVSRGGERTTASIFRGDQPSPRRPTRLRIAAATQVPDFALRTLNGNHQVTLRSLRGRWVLLNFWGTYCAPCRIEAPILSRLARVEARRLTVLGLDVNDTPATAKAFLATNPRSYPMLDAGMLKDRLAVSYGVGNPDGGGSIPVSVLIAPDGAVAYVQGGFWEPSPLESEVHSYLDSR